MNRLKIAENALRSKNFTLAAEEVDEILLLPAPEDEVLLSACFIQARILAEISTIPANFEKDVSNDSIKQGDDRKLRNAVAFVMKGLELAIQNKLTAHVHMAGNLFWMLTQSHLKHDQLSSKYCVPLATVVKALDEFEFPNKSLRITMHITLMSILIEHAERDAKKEKEKDDVNANEAGDAEETSTPWPSKESWTELLKNISEVIFKSLETAIQLSRSAPDLRYMLFNIVKVYLRYLKLHPPTSSSKATNSKIDAMFNEDGTLERYMRLHSLEDDQLKSSDMEDLITEVEKICDKCQNGDEAISIILDFAEQCIRRGYLEVSDRLLGKSALVKASPVLSQRRDLIVLQLELKKEATSESVDIRRTQELFARITEAMIKSIDIGCDTSVIHSCCLQCWSTLQSLSLMNEPRHPWIASVLKMVCEASGRRPGLDLMLRCNFEYELSKCYESQNIFTLATYHAERAKELCRETGMATEIDILLHKLWIKANTFDGNLAPELKALSLADQAKYIDAPNIAFEMLEKALKTLVPDHDLISPSADLKSVEALDRLMKTDFCWNSDINPIITSNGSRLVLVAVSDIMRQSKTLAENTGTLSEDACRKAWKLTFDTASYLLSNDWKSIVDGAAWQKLQTE
ncbi:hypothetical protein HDU76_001132, partial [Blyttiomyces sp. JEL0837]